MKVKYSDIQHLVIAATLVLTATCYDLVVLAGIPITVLILLECASILCVISRTCKKITVAGLVSAAMFFLIVWRNSYQGSFYFIYLVLLYALLLLLISASLVHYDYRWFRWYISLSAIMYAVYAIATYICAASPSLYFNHIVPLYPDNASRLTKWYLEGCNAGITSHYSTNGMFLAIGTMIGVSGLIANWDTPKRKRFLLYSILCGSALLLTGKRGPLLFSVAAIYIMYYFYLSNKPKNRFLNFFGITILLFLMVFVLVNVFDQLQVGLLRLLEDSESGDVTNGRLVFWGVALNLFRQRPLLGIGWANYRTIMQSFTGYNRAAHVHNIYIQLLCETGLVGTAFFLAFFFSALKRTIKNFIRIRKEQDSISSMFQSMIAVSTVLQAFFLLYGITGNPLYDSMVFVPYFCSVAFIESNQYEVDE